MTQNDVWNSFQSFILQVEEDPIMFLMDSNKPKLHKKALIRFFFTTRIAILTYRRHPSQNKVKPKFFLAFHVQNEKPFTVVPLSLSLPP